MEAKKSKKADLKNKRTLFFEIGMVLSLAFVLAAFQWTTNDKLAPIDLVSELDFDIEDMWLPENTKRDDPEPPKPEVVDVITIVEDIDDIPDIFVPDAEGDLDIPIVIIPLEDERIDETEPDIFRIVEQMPVYPGGKTQLMRDIMSNVHYPEIALQNGIQGKVFVEFIVNNLGKVDRVKIIRGVDPSLDAEVLRVIKELKGWTAGMQRGKAVNVSFTVPINFRLN